MTTVVSQGNPIPTFLSLGMGTGLVGGADETDIVFFVPPRDEPLRSRARTVHDTATHRVARTVEYFDSVGRRVAEVYRSGSDDEPGADTPGHTDSERLVAELVRCVVGRFGAERVRRFRTRIIGAAGSEPLVCTDGVLQRYRTDHESVQDVAVVCATEAGTVVARAWVTVADDAVTEGNPDAVAEGNPDAVTEGIPA